MKDILKIAIAAILAVLSVAELFIFWALLEQYFY